MLKLRIHQHTRSTLRFAVALVLSCLYPASSGAAVDSIPELTSDNNPATAGFFRLSWESNAERIELQEGSDADFQEVTIAYIGPDRAAVISGKPNGTWFYRVRALSGSQAGPWSEPVAVTVSHHSFTRALMFLLLGIIVFAATAWMIVRGSVKTE